MTLLEIQEGNIVCAHDERASSKGIFVFEIESVTKEFPTGADAGVITCVIPVPGSLAQYSRSPSWGSREWRTVHEEIRFNIGSLFRINPTVLREYEKLKRV